LKKEELQKRRESKKEPKEPEETDIVFTPGTILKFSGIGDNQTREALKELFSPYGDISYVDFTKNLNEGYIRFKNVEDCTKAFTEVTNNKMQIGDKLPTYVIITGDEEKQYWQKVKKAKTQNFTRKGKGKGKGKGNNKNSKPKVKGEKRKREEPANDESKKSKKVKVE